MVLQHRRERFHPFNTVRILAQSLQRCTVISDHTSRLAELFNATELSSRVGLLFPGPDSDVLSELPAAQLPDQLVVLDGTWHHAKTLMRDVPRLSQLPRVCLVPPEPGRYRIRREPNEHALSTLEATAAALRVLEPNTSGLDHLLDAFDGMIDTQLTNPKSNWRQNERRRRGSANVPRILEGSLENIVVAYGERERGGARYDSSPVEQRSGAPVYWVAQRLVSGERFACLVQSDSWNDTSFIQQLGLAGRSVADAASVGSFAAAWRAFLRPDDHVAVFHPSTARLIANVDDTLRPAVVLKSIHLDSGKPASSLDDFLASQGIDASPRNSTRAAARLANAIAFVRHLNTLRNA